MRASNMLTNGNLRMDIPTFSLPAITTCKGSTEHCKKWCYARKAEKRFPNVIKKRRENYIRSKWKLNFIGKISSEMCDISNKYIRIHQSGDFYSQRYLNKWFKICKAFPKKKFLVYTQMYRLDFSKKPKNLVIYYSVWDDSNKNKIPKNGLKAYVMDNGYNHIANYDIPKETKICPKGRGKSIKCNDCMWCFNGKGDIKFKLH